MSVSPTTIKMEADFAAGTAPVWVDFWEDVRAGSTKAVYGIRGYKPKQRCASGGSLKFEVLNSILNSGGKQGYYSPGHTDARSGFVKGLTTRLAITYGGTTYYKFRGRMIDIKPTPGKYRERISKCKVRDWIGDSAKIKPEGLEVQENKTADQLLTTMLTKITNQPPATDFDTGKSTFAYAFDNVRDGKTAALRIMRDTIISEYGYITEIGDQVQGGTLQLENRHARVLETTVQITLDDDGDDDDWMEMVVADSEGHVWNIIRGTVFPRVVDGAADQVLWELTGDVPTISPGDSKTIIGRYRDPDNPGVKIAGMDIVTPAAGTDYVFSSSEGGGGDMNGDLGVVSTLGGNSVKYVVTNNGSAMGYLDTLQVRGKRVLLYEPALVIQEDDSREEDLLLNIQFPYQDNILEGQDFIDYLYSTWNAEQLIVKSVSFYGNKSDTLMTHGLELEPGKRIGLIDSVSGIDGEYFINGVGLSILPADILKFTWYVTPAGTESFFILDTSLLDTGRLGF